MRGTDDEIDEDSAEIKEDFHVILNPKAGGGRARREWPRSHLTFSTLFPKLTVHETERRGHATEIARELAENKAQVIIVIGGDGTLNEVINGLFYADGVAVNPRTEVRISGSGVGCDFARHFGYPSGQAESWPYIVRARSRWTDIGCVTATSETGEPVSRLFLNIASVGFSADVVRRTDRAYLSRSLPGRVFFQVHTLLALSGHKPYGVRVKCDDGDFRDHASSFVCVANASCFGGGLAIAPEADTSDGLFDVVIAKALDAREFLASPKLLREKKHFETGLAQLERARRVELWPADDRPVYLELDGEVFGKLPAVFTLSPKALRLAI